MVEVQDRRTTSLRETWQLIGWVGRKAAGAAMWIWGTVGDIVNTAIGAGVTVVNDVGGYLTFNPPTIRWAKARTTTGDYTTLVSVGGLSNFIPGGLAIGRTIILSSDAEHNPGVRNHEPGHVPQSRIYGIFYVPIVGGTTWLRKRSPFERDADARGISLDYMRK